MKEIDPKQTKRAKAYELWMKAPNPMVTFFKTLDVTPIVNKSKKSKLKFNMLLDYCIGRAASNIEEFYLLPVGDKLIQYDTIAVNTILQFHCNTITLKWMDLMQVNFQQTCKKKYIILNKHILIYRQDWRIEKWKK